MSTDAQNHHPREIELKLALPTSDPAGLLQRLSRTPLLARRKPAHQHLNNVYYDTPEQLLREHRAALRIRRTPGVCGGEACIGMTRVAVWMLEEAKRAGVGELDLLKDYPGLSVDDLDAAWRYVETHREEIDQAIRTNREA